MELPHGINRRYASLAGILLVAVWLWVAFDRPYNFPSHIPWNIYSNGPQVSVLTDIFDYPPLRSLGIKNVCAGTNWNESVVFVCDQHSGGVAEVRNSVLSCVRYAMAAGGSLVVPGIVLADDYEGMPAGNTTTFDYMFDTAHLINSLHLSCPQMRVYDSLLEIADIEHANGPLLLDAPTLVEKEKTNEVVWREAFYKWLTQYLSQDTKGPIIISLKQSFLQWPVQSDAYPFFGHFSKVLKPRDDIRRLATTTLLKLSEAHSVSLDYSDTLFKNAYLGAYLNIGMTSSKDDATFSQYETQSKLFLGQATSRNLSVIYVASHEGTDIPQFIKDANEMELDATSKLDLLKGNDREYLLEMAPQQQSFIDFLVLSKSSDFAGVGHSNLAWSIALRRHQFSSQSQNWLDQGQLMDDQLSQIYGKPGTHPEFPKYMWP